MKFLGTHIRSNGQVASYVNKNDLKITGKAINNRVNKESGLLIYHSTYPNETVSFPFSHIACN